MKKVGLALSAVCFLSFLSTAVYSQGILQSQKPDLLRSPLQSGQGLSLFAPSRFSFRNSYTLSFMSNGRQGNLLGLYVGSVNYQIAKPLEVTVNLGYLHQPQNFVARNRQSGINGQILPSIRLDFRPSENFFFRIDVGSYPAWGGTPNLYDPYYFWNR